MEKVMLDRIEEFRGFIPYVQGLESVEESLWNQPLAEGKWTMKDVICHIALWDEYFYQEGIEKVKLGQPLAVKHLDYDEFNANAVRYAKTQTIDSLIEQAVRIRTKIVDTISSLPEEELDHEFTDADGHPFTVREYLNGFIPHDEQHKHQIDDYLRRAHEQVF